MAEKKIEDALNEYFTGDTLKNALNFAEFLSANEMIYNGDYEIHYKGKLACYIDTPNGTDSLAMRFNNPDVVTVECVKKMVDMRKYAVDNHTV